MIYVKKYGESPFDTREILRYTGTRNENDQTLKLIEDCLKEADSVLRYKVCYRELNVSIKDNICDFRDFKIKSSNLSKNLNGCKRVIIFAATLGIDFDRIIAKYSKLSPAKAVIFQAIGAERIESLCDTFCADIKKEYNASLKPRFSPGYGDLPLETQKDIFAVLDCERKIGITLNDSLLMSPSKSVTAFIGLNDNTHSEV